MKIDKKHLPLVIGLSLPVLMTLFISGSIYLPKLFAPEPKFDFIYSASDNHGWPDVRFTVENGTLRKMEQTYPEQAAQKDFKTATVVLYRYHIKTNQSERLSFEAAQKLKLVSGEKSPDNFEVVRGDSDGGLGLLYSRGSSFGDFFLKGHGTARKLNLEKRGSFYWNPDGNVIGWIVG
ncbi:MAG: hypothetical protein A2351_00200 [Omnitrophica bacterium RIFOXYB12_FULL_50_7]|nr:MAG: hypothetical protein A2351_00200 [Omnitrophica bacterium RIFOXYB12_FULL_50_7]